MAAVEFSYSQWQFRYPEFATTVPAGMAAALFAEASLYLLPGDGSVVADEGQRLVILGMIVAHLAAIAAMPVGLTGRISGASEGSVSVTTAAYMVPNTAEWWALTRYGMSAYQALAPYRTARYLPGPGAFRRPYSPGPGGVSPWFRGF